MFLLTYKLADYRRKRLEIEARFQWMNKLHELLRQNALCGMINSLFLTLPMFVFTALRYIIARLSCVFEEQNSRRRTPTLISMNPDRKDWS